MRNKMLVATLMMIALIVSACGSGPTPVPAPTNPPAPANPPVPAQPAASGTDPLAGTSWTLTTLNGQPSLADTTADLSAEEQAKFAADPQAYIQQQ